MTEIYGTFEVMKLPEGKWQLLSNPIYFLDSGKSIKIDHGFIFDGGSVPQAFWSLGLTPVGTDADFAFLLHDWLYAKSRMGVEITTRHDADLAMLEVMLYSGVDSVLAHGAYTAVRAAAYPNWGDGSPDEPEGLLEDPAGFEWFRDG